MQEIKFFIVTGLSGAGRSTVIRSFEDMGFFCVDNLPPALIPKFSELVTKTLGKINRVALVIDIRGGEFFDDLFECLNKVKEKGINYEIIFLEASNETLVRRFKESRRHHPLKPHGRVLDGIIEERIKLEELKGRANIIINTTNLTLRQLKEQIVSLYGDSTGTDQLLVTVISFGYKYGIPLDSDLVIDVRFLANPYYIKELKDFTGNDQQVKDYVFNSPITVEFMAKFTELVEFLIPHYIKEGKTNLTIAIGCTGGQHRSVALANEVGEILRKKDYRILVRHRDIPQLGGIEKE